MKTWIKETAQKYIVGILISLSVMFGGSCKQPKKDLPLSKLDQIYMKNKSQTIKNLPRELKTNLK